MLMPSAAILWEVLSARVGVDSRAMELIVTELGFQMVSKQLIWTACNTALILFNISHRHLCVVIITQLIVGIFSSM